MPTEEITIEVTERPKCVVCGKEQTDVIFIESYETFHHKMYVGFPVCSDHTLQDLKPDQYVMNNLIVEVH